MRNDKLEKKNIIIIGAGISGLTAGIYALENGYNVSIYEKHSIAGGECTGWVRDNVFIDGCAHWIVGTNNKGQLFKLWKHIHAFDENSKIYNTDYFNKFDINGEIVTFYSDIKLLKAELLRIAPNDKKVINEFIRGIKAYRSVTIPIKKPMDLMNPIDYAQLGLKLLPMARAYKKYTHITIEEFANKCKSEILKETFNRALFKEFNVHSLLYVMQALAKKDAGVVEGGSVNLVNRVLDYYKSLGGKIYLHTEVSKIIVENDEVKGIMKKDGSIINADYVISSTDEYHTLKVLLDNKYRNEYFDSRLEDIKNNKLPLAILCSYKITKDMSTYPKMMNFEIEPFNIGETEVKLLTLRSHAFDKTLNKDSSTITVLLRPGMDIYDTYKNLSKEDYKKEKERIGNIVLNNIKNYYKLNNDEIKLIDVTTPLTYERYLNAYKGSYMSFVTSSNHKKLMDTGLVKGLKNFVMAGQWIMPPGGLPVALFTGKHAAYRITRWDKKKFINKA